MCHKDFWCTISFRLHSRNPTTYSSSVPTSTLLPRLLLTAHELVFVSEFPSHFSHHSICCPLTFSIFLLLLLIFFFPQWTCPEMHVLLMWDSRHVPGHHAANAGPSTPAHQETHCWVCDCIPGAAHKQDDRGIERIQLEGEKGKRSETWTQNKEDTKYYLLWNCWLASVNGSKETQHQVGYGDILRLCNCLEYDSSELYNIV